MELKRGLEALDFVPSPFDPCTFVLPDPSTGATEGIIKIHVDDGKLFQQKLQQLSEKFPFGSQQKSIFTFTGLRVDQQPDQSICINQTQYINNNHPISIPRDRRMKPDDPVSEDERQSYSRPGMCSRFDGFNLGSIEPRCPHWWKRTRRCMKPSVMRMSQ